MDVLRKQGILFFVIENRVCSVARSLLNDSKLGRLFFYVLICWLMFYYYFCATKSKI